MEDKKGDKLPTVPHFKTLAQALQSKQCPTKEQIRKEWIEKINKLDNV